MTTLALTKSGKKSKVVNKEVYSQKEMLEKAAAKLSEFGLNQKDLIAVSYINDDEDKNACLGVILKGIFRDEGKVYSLSINFYDNGNVSYIKSTGRKSERSYEKLTKSQFTILVNSLSDASEVFDKF